MYRIKELYCFDKRKFFKKRVKEIRISRDLEQSSSMASYRLRNNWEVNGEEYVEIERGCLLKYSSQINYFFSKELMFLTYNNRRF